MITGDVVRFELPNLGALISCCTARLDGGGTLSLKTDAQESLFHGAVRMVIDVRTNVAVLRTSGGMATTVI